MHNITICLNLVDNTNCSSFDHWDPGRFSFDLWDTGSSSSDRYLDDRCSLYDSGNSMLDRCDPDRSSYIRQDPGCFSFWHLIYYSGFYSDRVRFRMFVYISL